MNQKEKSILCIEAILKSLLAEDSRLFVIEPAATSMPIKDGLEEVEKRTLELIERIDSMLNLKRPEVILSSKERIIYDNLVEQKRKSGKIA